MNKLTKEKMKKIKNRKTLNLNLNYDEVCLVKYLLTSALIQKGADPLKGNKNVSNYSYKIEHTNIKQLKNLQKNINTLNFNHKVDL